MNNITWVSNALKRDDAEEIFDCIEKISGIRYPEDFKRIAIEFPEGHPNPCLFDIPGENGKQLDKLQCFDPKSFDFIWYGGLIRSKDMMYPFATDIQTNTLFFDYKQGFPPGVVYMDRNNPGHYIFVAKSFEDFLEMLY